MWDSKKENCFYKLCVLQYMIFKFFFFTRWFLDSGNIAVNKVMILLSHSLYVVGREQVNIHNKKQQKMCISYCEYAKYLCAYFKLGNQSKTWYLMTKMQSTRGITIQTKTSYGVWGTKYKWMVYLGQKEGKMA